MRMRGSQLVKGKSVYFSRNVLKTYSNRKVVLAAHQETVCGKTHVPNIYFNPVTVMSVILALTT